MNCKFYDKRKPNQCRVDNAGSVIDKETANFCEEFQFADRPLPGRDKGESKKAKKLWKKLFKKQDKSS